MKEGPGPALRVAIVGGGTAGYIAATHLSKHFPQFDLYHVFDASIPPIGVGEGTTLNFPPWLSEVTGVSEQELVERCHVTRKFGIKFENWGTRHAEFMQHFHPVGQYAYHISADTIIELLAEHVRATRIDAKVTVLESDGSRRRPGSHSHEMPGTESRLALCNTTISEGRLLYASY